MTAKCAIVGIVLGVFSEKKGALVRLIARAFLVLDQQIVLTSLLPPLTQLCHTVSTDRMRHLSVAAQGNVCGDRAPLSKSLSATTNLRVTSVPLLAATPVPLVVRPCRICWDAPYAGKEM